MYRVLIDSVACLCHRGRRRLAALSVVGLALSGWVGTTAQAAALRIATGEWPPYATQSRSDQGIALDIVRRAFALSGHTVEYHFLPWTRAQHDTKTGLYDASAYWGASAERRRDFLLSDNVLTERWLLVYRRELALDWRNLADLAPYRVGVIRDYTYTPEFWSLVEQGKIQADSTPNDLTGLRKMLLKRIDVMPMELNVACDLLARFFTIEESTRFVAHPRPLTEAFSTHVILPRQLARSAVLLEDFNAGLKRLRESGEYAKRLKSVSCPPAWGEAVR